MKNYVEHIKTASLSFMKKYIGTHENILLVPIMSSTLGKTFNIWAQLFKANDVVS